MTAFVGPQKGGGPLRGERMARLRRLARVTAKGDIVLLALGRFGAVRRLYALVTARRQALGLGKAALTSNPTAFADLDTAEAVEAVRRQALYEGVRLSPERVAVIKAFAQQAPCIRPHLTNRFAPLGADTTERFTMDQVVQGRLPGGDLAPMALVVDAEACPQVAELAHDAALLEVTAGLLGFRPAKVRAKLFWSFAAQVSEDDRRRLHQTIDYHYDIESYAFVYVNFYLTDTDRSSGAHAMVKESHRHKPLRMLLGSTRRPRQAVVERWGAGNEIVLEGPAGFGFIQDSSCFHRAIAPVTADRLFLQLRYS